MRVHNLSLTLGQHPCLQSLSFSLKAGELVGILGPNGAGKSSLLHCLVGLQPAHQGAVFFKDKPAKAWSSAHKAQFMGYLPQAHTVHWPLRVEQVVELGLTPHLLSGYARGHDWSARIEQAMQATEVLDLRQRRIDQISGGEQLRALLARVLVAEPELVLADEPVASLDPYHQLSVMRHLQRYCHEVPNTPNTISSNSSTHNSARNACIVVLHDLNLAARYCDRLLLLHQGKLVAEGSPEQVLIPETLKAVYGLDYQIEPKTIDSPLRLYPR